MVEHHFHASIVLNVHREAVFLRRTLLSLDEAVQYARSRGLRLELVVVFDRTDPDTRQVASSFDFSAYNGLQFIDVDHGSLGLARNAGIERARGEYVFTADADDLLSCNYFHDIHVEAERLGPRALYFPEYVFTFGESAFICRYSGLDEVSPMTFVDKQPYISRVCAHRDALRKIPYRDVRLSRGYAYEDWHFNAEAVGAGLNIHTVKDTILFYRQRPGSLLKSADALSIRQIPPARLFKPLTYLEISESSHQRLFAEAAVSAEAGAAPQDPLDSDHVRAMIRSANAIEPAISLHTYRGVPAMGNSMGIPPLGVAYYTLCDIVRDRSFSDIFIVPFFSRGGAEKYLLSLIEAMYRIAPVKDFLVILGEELKAVQWMDRLPPNATVVDMNLHCPSLSIDQRCLLALKIIETSAPDTRVHLRQSAFADRLLSLYGIVLQERECIYYRFADVERTEDGHAMTVYSQTRLLSENLNYLSKIVCDSKTIIAKDLHRFGVQAQKWQFLPPPVEAQAVLPVRDADARRRILWASRLDIEKRPSLLPLIASKLGSLGSDLSIDVFGGSVFSGFDRTRLEGLPNLRYHDRFQGFDALPLSRFSIFLYTSLHDGIPNAILEAMSYGLAVVAPDVGGISEVVIDGETGILLRSLPDDDDMAASYARVLLTLVSNPDLGAKLGKQARAYVCKNHSPQAHTERVAELFNLKERHLQYA
ncbi:glycosyltransferase [Microvirga splendida]|uniref:Glycosyltransferase n=1 Tax=Microvirga splendida TaxID=2795727 RepID=A0ABS0Y8H6_9HYPH|nr:glycosyltransferase [Microvirga splendida]MBJ6128208.1 glycosyltransferase [Microvirga splendida]